VHQIGNILTDRQREYVIARHSDELYISAIAENYGVNRSTVFRTLQRAYRRLIAAGITPPPDPRRASLRQIGGASRVCVTVDPHKLSEMIEG
jgi:hypothetical protein